MQQAYVCSFGTGCTGVPVRLTTQSPPEDAKDVGYMVPLTQKLLAEFILSDSIQVFVELPQLPCTSDRRSPDAVEALELTGNRYPRRYKLASLEFKTYEW